MTHSPRYSATWSYLWNVGNYLRFAGADARNALIASYDVPEEEMPQSVIDQIEQLARAANAAKRLQEQILEEMR